jgi:N-acetylmuramoyl-L-alanine amidase
MIVKQNLVDKSKHKIKCPFQMAPQFIVIHNTANDASADAEISFMIGNDKQVSYHYAVDDKEAVQGILESRNAWHCGDGGQGKGNRYGIGIEICYSKTGGPKFDQAERNAAKLAAEILKRYKWPISKVTKHQDYSGKYCPHRTLDLGWDRFLKMVAIELEPVKPLDKPSAWADEAWTKAFVKGILDGKNPQGNVTREMLAKVLDNLGLLD